MKCGVDVSVLKEIGSLSVVIYTGFILQHTFYLSVFNVYSHYSFSDFVLICKKNSWM
jgi:hypothetical protein